MRRYLGWLLCCLAVSACLAKLPMQTGFPAPETIRWLVPVTVNGAAASPRVVSLDLGGPAIWLAPEEVMHRTSSHVLGTVRNHVARTIDRRNAQLAKMKELLPTWGQHQFIYRMGHGPTDGRYDYPYMTGYHFEQAWNQDGPYPYDDLRHYLEEATAMGAAQLHVINFGTGTPEEAARYVSYLNGADDANRAQYPYARQDARLFELGNEISWSAERGHLQFAPNETTYAERAKVFAQQMRAASDVPIQIGAVASTNSSWTGNGWSGGANTVKNILTTMGTEVDFLTYHGYPSWPVCAPGNKDLLQIMAQNEWNKNKIEQEIKPAILRHAGGRDIWIGNTEFMAGFYQDAMRARGLFGALYAADTIILAMNQDIRLAPLLGLDHEDAADDSFFFGDDPANPTAIFKLEALLAKHWGDQVVRVHGRSIPTVEVKGTATTITVPRLAFAAATRDDKVYLLVLNRLNDADVKTTIDPGFTPQAITAFELSGSAGWDSPNATVMPKTDATLTGYSFKRASVTLFEMAR